MAWGAKIISFLYAAHNPTQANPGVHTTLYTTHLILPVLGGIGGVGRWETLYIGTSLWGGSFLVQGGATTTEGAPAPKYQLCSTEGDQHPTRRPGPMRTCVYRTTGCTQWLRSFGNAKTITYGKPHVPFFQLKIIADGHPPRTWSLDGHTLHGGSGGRSPPAAGGHGSEHLFIVVVQILCELAASS